MIEIAVALRFPTPIFNENTTLCDKDVMYTTLYSNKIGTKNWCPFVISVGYKVNKKSWFSFIAGNISMDMSLR